MRRCQLACLGLLLFLPAASPAAPAPRKKMPKEALQAFNDLIGSWRGTGEPTGTQEERQRGFWQEKIEWQWQFKGKDAWLSAAIARGKYATAAELRYLPDADLYQLTVTTPAKEKRAFKGKLVKKRLTLEREDAAAKETQRLVVSLLHSNRYLYAYEVKRAGQPTFKPVYRVGATKEGEDFASDDDGPECVVSGGLGKFALMYKGKTYYVCCSGCRDAFNEDPEKYIKEFEARKKKGKK